MTRIKDLTGQKFGKLTVFEFYKRENDQTKWLCKCDCGNEKIVCSRSLKTGDTKSCGCLYKNNGGYLFKDLTGQKFGKLTVIERSDNTKQGQSRWLCKCDCGNEKVITRSHLVNGEIKSCGCILKGNTNPNWKGGPNVASYDTFNNKIDFCEETRRNPENKIQLQVKCTHCKKWFNPTRIQLQNRIREINNNGSRFYCSEECKLECPIYNKIKWPEGQSPYKNDRPGQKEWSDLVKENANYKCEICGSTEYLEAHHIESINFNPVESMDVDNGVCLCYRCHRKVHSDKGCRHVDLTKNQLCKY